MFKSHNMHHLLSPISWTNSFGARFQTDSGMDEGRKVVLWWCTLHFTRSHPCAFLRFAESVAARSYGPAELRFRGAATNLWVSRSCNSMISQRCNATKLLLCLDAAIFAAFGGCYVRNWPIIRDLLLIIALLIRKLLSGLPSTSLMASYHFQMIILLFKLLLQHLVLSWENKE